MYRYKNLLVCLDISSKDEAVLKFADFVSKLAKSNRVICVHCMDSDEVPQSLIEKYGMESLDTSARKQVQQSVEKYFKADEGTELSVVIARGTPLDEVLHLANDKDIDLIICGKSNEKKAHDVLPKRIAHKSRCSVLFVPENSNPKLEKILVPVDDSTYSGMAVDVASAFGKSGGVQKLSLLRTCYMPIDHDRDWMSRKVRIAELKNDKRNMVETFTTNCNLRGLPFETLIEVNTDPDTAILKLSEAEGFDLVVMGCRGKNAVAAAFLGSTAALVAKKTSKPLIIVKKKGESASLLDHLTVAE